MLVTLFFVISVIFQSYSINTVVGQDPAADDSFSVECLKTENVTSDNAFDFFTKNLTLAEYMPNLKCYAACCLERMNALDGCTFKPKSGKKYVTDNGLRKDMLSAFDACHNSSISVERCECGYEVFKCVIDYMDRV